MKRYVLVSLAASAVIATALVGCGGKSGSDSVAEINGQKISNQEFINAVARTPGAGQALSGLLDEQLWLGMAKDQGVAPTDEQVNKRLAFLNKTQDLDWQIKDSGATIDDIKNQLKVQQAKINLAEKSFGSKVTDDEVKQAYDASKAQMYTIPERTRLDIIILQSKDAADKASKELKSGTDMKKVAEDNGSQLRHVSLPKNAPGLPPALAKAVTSTPKGKTSDPVSMSGMMGEQFVIIRVAETVPAVTISQDEAKPMIKGDLALQKASADSDYTKKTEDAKKDAKITISVPALKSVEKEFKNPAPAMPMMMPGGPGGQGGPAPRPRQ